MALKHFHWSRVNEGIYMAASAGLELEVVGDSPGPTSHAYYWQVENKKAGVVLANGQATALDTAIEEAEQAGRLAAIKLDEKST
jgi:hypothetical protein